MAIVNYPMSLGDSGDNVLSLQQLLLAFVSNGIIELTDSGNTLINNLRCCEIERKFFGSSTLALVQLYCQQKGIAVKNNPVVDEEVATALNLDYLNLPEGQVYITGQIRYANFSQYPIEQDTGISLSLVTFLKTQVVDRVTIPAGNVSAFYSFYVNASDIRNSSGGVNGLMVTATINGSVINSDTIYSLGKAITIDLILDESVVSQEPDVVGIQNRLSEISGGNISAIDYSDPKTLELLQSGTGESSANIINIIEASKSSDITGVDIEILYGIYTQNLPSVREQVLYRPADTLLQQLKVSMANNIITGQDDSYLTAQIDLIKETLITNWVSDSTDTQSILERATSDMTNHVLNDTALTASFLNLYYQYDSSKSADNAFWDYLLNEDARFSAYKAPLVAVLTNSNLVYGNSAVTKRLQSIISGASLKGDPVLSGTLPVNAADPRPEYLATLTSNDWLTVIKNAYNEDGGNFFFPDNVSGDSDTEKLMNYASIAFATVEQVYPARSFATQATVDSNNAFPNIAGSMPVFLTNNPSYDFRTSTIYDIENGAFDMSGITDVTNFKEEIATIQRLMPIAATYENISSLKASGYASSVAISRTPLPDFLDTMSNTKLATRATSNATISATATLTSLYQIASSNTMFNMAQAFNLPTLQLFNWNSIFSNYNAASTATYAEWYNLFGALDYCSCKDCQSVFGPAAYFVDLLQFLKAISTPVYNELAARRPDIINILLNCDNSLTELPQIDIINELLEDLVSFGYYEHGAYKMYARQTQNAADLQRVFPEYINTNGENVPVQTGTNTNDYISVKTPYPILAKATYPWVFPYNFYLREAQTALTLPDVPPYQLIQRISNLKFPFAFADAGYDVAYLGSSKEHFDIITSLENPLYGAYGFKLDSGTTLQQIKDPTTRGNYITVSTDSNATNYWVTVIAGRVDVFLQQTGMTYTELLTLLDCYYINPFITETVRQMAILSSSTDNDNCDTSLMYISGLTEGDLQQIYRFVRLARLAGWNYYDLDKILNNLGYNDINEDVFKTVAQIQYLSKSQNYAVSKVILYQKDIDTKAYSIYGSDEPVLIPTEYESLFRNPAVSDISAADYPFKADPTDNEPVSTAVLTDYIAGILALSATDTINLLDALFPGATTIATDLSTLSIIYRECLLLKGLSLTVSEWLFYKQWVTQTQYYGPDGNNALILPFTGFDNTLYFSYRVKTVKNTGVSYQKLDYILRDNPINQASDDQNNNTLAQLLTDFRTQINTVYPFYNNAATDTDSTALQLLLNQIMDISQSAQLAEIMERAATSGVSYTDADRTFIGETLSFFIPSAGVDMLAPESTSNPAYISGVTARRTQVYDWLLAYQLTNVIQPQTAAFFVRQFSIGVDIIDALLGTVITVNNTSGYDCLLNLDFLQSTDTPDRWAQIATDQFHVLLLIDKASILITSFNLGLVDVQWIWGSQVLPGTFALSALPIRTQRDVLPVPASSSSNMPVTFLEINNLLGWMRFRAFLSNNVTLFYSLLSGLNSGSYDKATAEQAISTLFASNSADIATLLGSGTSDSGRLDIAFPSGYQDYNTYLRLMDSFDTQSNLPAPMSNLVTIAQGLYDASNPDSTTDLGQDVINRLLQTVKSNYNDTNWMTAIQPINDTLRAERRDAMVTWLLNNPPTTYESQWYDSNDIYATLMIDVEMMPIVQTSRIVLATNMVQVWVDRILMGMELYYDTLTHTWKLLSLSTTQAKQWRTWRNLYRLWEANRKIFIYPENWIEPELRDNKTPFFKEVEKFLDQNELSDDILEQAFDTYLERLDEVAHLEMIAIHRVRPVGATSGYNAFDAGESDDLYIFGRTPSSPHIYYYRTRLSGVWGAWNKIDNKIDSDHFVAVIWHGRLRLYWLEFSKDDMSKSSTTDIMRSTDTFTTPPPSRWKIELAWTELKNGVWSGSQKASDPLYSFTVYEASPISNDHVQWFSWHPNAYNQEGYRWFFDGSLEKQRLNINFTSRIDPDGNLSFEINEVVESLSGSRLNHMFYDSQTMPNYHNDPSAMNLQMTGQSDMTSAINQVLNGFMEYMPEKMGYFFVNYKGVTTVPLKGYLSDYDWFWMMTENGLPFRFDGYKYKYEGDTNIGYTHYSDGNNMLLLKKAPDNDDNGGQMSGKFLIFPMNVPDGYPYQNSSSTKLSMPYFFYEDYQNCFFVEKQLLPFQTVQLIGTASLFGAASSNNVSEKALASSTALLNLSSSSLLQVQIAGSASSLGSVSIGTSTSNTQASILNNTNFSNQVIYSTYYQFWDFHIDKVHDFREQLYTDGIDGLLDRHFVSGLTDTLNFSSRYQPTANVRNIYPSNAVSFDYDNPHGMYMWELFFHLPMIIASKLNNYGQYELAMKWYRYIFDPTSSYDATNNSSNVHNFWNVVPFYNSAITANTATPLSLITGNGLNSTLLNAWANDPFNPHLIARSRIVAYMKNVVMKYVDNLIDWGDALYRTDTRENINEAALLYITALQLLGKQPEQLPARAQHADNTYAVLLQSGLNAFSNALVNVENLQLSTGATTIGVTTTPASLSGSMYYFCLVANDYLQTYWTTIADRLYKIRNSMNIDGVERALALLAPPIDPALLVRAAAQGISIADALAAANAPLPIYRFQVISQKATEVAGMVQGLGSQLLSALEKKDAEMLSLLRNSQEISVLQMAIDMKELQVSEAEEQVTALQQQQAMSTQRLNYYQGLIDAGQNIQETLQLDSMALSFPLNRVQNALLAAGSAGSHIPNVMVGAFSAGVQYGGLNLSEGFKTAAGVVGMVIEANNLIGSMAGIKAGYLRRTQDWKQQVTQTTLEIQQLDTQITAAQIRYQIAQNDYESQKLQLSNAQEMDTAMRDKFTNEDLYDWMVGQISFTYKQAYNLALDLGRKAERSFRNELNLTDSAYIQSAYWNSIYKGLLAGEQLSNDIKRMEAAYLDKNVRQLELTKSISLAQMAPEVLLNLIANENHKEIFSLMEEWFDMDYPGQYMRRIKSISISIPCVAGPYTVVSCNLTLNTSRYRQVVDLNTGTDGYAYTGTDDTRFTNLYGNIQSLCTSSAQNDSGMFDFNFRDERYLPFEGAGVIGDWTIELPALYAQFDYNTIRDVIVHINYTALNGGTLLKNAANSHLQNWLAAGQQDAGMQFALMSLPQDFSNAWNLAVSEAAGSNTATIPFTLTQEQFAFMSAQAGNIQVLGWSMLLVSASAGLTASVTATALGVSGLNLNNETLASTDPLAAPVSVTASGVAVSMTVSLAANHTLDEVTDLFLIGHYSAGQATS